MKSGLCRSEGDVGYTPIDLYSAGVQVYWVDAVRDPISGWKSGLMVLILHYCMGGVAVNFLVGLDYYVDLVL